MLICISIGSTTDATCTATRYKKSSLSPHKQTSSSTRNFLSSYASNLFVYASLSQNIYCTADCLYIMHCTCTGKSQIRQRDRRQNKTGGKQFERLSAN